MLTITKIVSIWQLIRVIKKSLKYSLRTSIPIALSDVPSLYDEILYNAMKPHSLIRQPFPVTNLQETTTNFLSTNIWTDDILTRHRYTIPYYSYIMANISTNELRKYGLMIKKVIERLIILKNVELYMRNFMFLYGLYGKD